MAYPQMGTGLSTAMTGASIGGAATAYPMLNTAGTATRNATNGMLGAS